MIEVGNIKKKKYDLEMCLKYLIKKPISTTRVTI